MPAIGRLWPSGDDDGDDAGNGDGDDDGVDYGDDDGDDNSVDAGDRSGRSGGGHLLDAAGSR